MKRRKRSPYQNPLEDVAYRIKNSYKKLEKNVYKKVPLKIIKKDSDDLMLLLGELNFLAKECKETEKPKRRTKRKK